MNLIRNYKIWFHSYKNNNVKRIDGGAIETKRGSFQGTKATTPGRK
ncbi:hypothetical protein [Niallia taxi]|nr:hypothetical protein [Niallia taxi]